MQWALIGGAGFIGDRLARRLVEHGQTVDVFDRQMPADATAAAAPSGPGTIRFHRHDASADPPTLAAGTDIVVHLAQSPAYRTWPQDAHALFAVNVAGVLATAEAAVRAGARAMIHASTGTVYGPAWTPRGEDGPTDDSSPYALSKITAERALRQFAAAAELRICSVRPFGVFGPGQRGMLVPGLTDRIRGGRPITLDPNPGDPADDGGLRLSLTPVEDCAAWLATIAERLAAGEVVPAAVNLAGGDAPSIRELAGHIGGGLGIEPIFETTDHPRAGDLVADRTRLTAMVGPGWTPLAEALQGTIHVPA
jgi:nucleoside-diphosphate-sugar epimerase